MQTTEAPVRLSTVFHCHLPPLGVSLPFVPFDHERFPALFGFADFSMATSAGWFGGTFSLVDISGLTKVEVEQRLKTDLRANLTVERIRFLQCLQYLSDRRAKGEAVPQFERIAAYVSREGYAVAAVPNHSVFRRAETPPHDVPWGPGTLGLFFVDSL